MASINEKLNYINETKSLIKDKLNDLGSEIEDETTFREYAEKIEDLYEKWPKVNDEDININLNNTKKEKMDIQLKGNINQFTTTGCNLLNIDGTRASEGLTNVTSGTVINVSGTSSNNYSSLTFNITQDIPIGTYTFSIQNKLNTRIGFIAKFDDNSEHVYHIATNTLSTTFTTDKKITSYRLYLETISGTQYNLTIKPQLENKSTTSDWEPYTGGIAAPNPSYAQDIYVVSGNNTIIIENKNLIAHDLSSIKTLNTDGTWNNNVYTKNGINFVINNDGSVRVYGTASANTYLTYPTFIISANTYTLSAGVYINTLTRIQLVEDITGRPVIASTENNASKSFTINASKNIFLQFRINDGEIIDKVFYPQLEKGNLSTTTYEPYQNQTYSINLGDIELCKIGTYQDSIVKDNDKWYLNKQIGKVVFNGTESWSYISGIASSNLFRISFSNYIKNVICYSNYYKGIANTSGRTNFNIYLLEATGSSNLDILDNRFTSANDFKTWLSTHNTIVYYVLATPTYVEITNSTLISQLEVLKKAISYDEQTNISQTNDNLPFIISASALLKNSN